MSLRRSSRIAGVGGDISPGSSTASSVSRIGSPALSTRSKKKVEVDYSALDRVRRRTLRGISESDSISVTGSKTSSRRSSPEKAKGPLSPARSSLKSDATDVSVSSKTRSRRSTVRSPPKQQTIRRTLRSRIIENSADETKELKQEEKEESANESSEEESALNTTVVEKQAVNSAETTPVKDQNDGGPKWDSPKGVMRAKLENLWQVADDLVDNTSKKSTSPSSNQSENDEKTKSPVKQKVQDESSHKKSELTPVAHVVLKKLNAAKALALLAEKSDGSISDASTELFIDTSQSVDSDELTNIKTKLNSPLLTKKSSSPKSSDLSENTSDSVLEKQVGTSTQQLSPKEKSPEKNLSKTISPEKIQSAEKQISSTSRRSSSLSPTKASPSPVKKTLTSLQKELNKSVTCDKSPDEELGSSQEKIEVFHECISSPLKISSEDSGTENKRKSKTLLEAQVESDDYSQSAGKEAKSPEKSQEVFQSEVVQRISPIKSVSPVKAIKSSSVIESESKEKIMESPAKSPAKSPKKTEIHLIEETDSDDSEVEVRNESPKKSQTTPVARITPLSKNEEKSMQPTRKSLFDDKCIVIEKGVLKYKSPEKRFQKEWERTATVQSPKASDEDGLNNSKTKSENKKSLVKQTSPQNVIPMQVDRNIALSQSPRAGIPVDMNSSKTKSENKKSPAKEKSKTPDPRVLNLDENSESEIESDRNAASKPINWRNKLEQKYKVKSNLAESSEESDAEFEESSDKPGSSSNEEPQQDDPKTKKLTKQLTKFTGKEILGESKDGDSLESDDGSSSEKGDVIDWKKKLERKYQVEHDLDDSSRDSDSEESESDDDHENSLAGFEPLKSDWRSDNLKNFANKEVIEDSSSDSEVVLDEESESNDSSDIEEITPTVFQPIQTDWRSETLKSLTENNYPSSESSSSNEFETPAKKMKTDSPVEKFEIPRFSSYSVQIQASRSGTFVKLAPQESETQKQISESYSCSKLQNWTILEEQEQNDRNIWGEKIVEVTVQKKKKRKMSVARQIREDQIKSKLNALRNWQVTPVSPEKSESGQSSKQTPAEVSTAQQPEIKRKKNKKKAQTLATDTTLSAKKDVQKVNTKGKTTVASSDSEPEEQSFETSKISAFAIMQEALQSARREEEAKKKKRRERNERLQSEKMSQSVKHVEAAKNPQQDKSKKRKKDTKLESAKVSMVPEKLPSSVLQQLEDKKQTSVGPVKTGETVRKRRKRKRNKKLMEAEQQSSVLNGNEKSSTITKFNVTDLETVQNTLFVGKKNAWRKNAMKRKKHNAGKKMTALKGKLEYLKKNQQGVPSWSS